METLTSLISSRCRICQYIHIVKRERERGRENELPPFLFLSRAELVIAPSGKDTRHAFHPILIHFSISFILFSFSSSYSLRYIYTLGVLHLISFFPRYLLTVLFSSVAHYLIRDSAYIRTYTTSCLLSSHSPLLSEYGNGGEEFALLAQVNGRASGLPFVFFGFQPLPRKRLITATVAFRWEKKRYSVRIELTLHA